MARQRPHDDSNSFAPGRRRCDAPRSARRRPRHRFRAHVGRRAQCAAATAKQAAPSAPASASMGGADELCRRGPGERGRARDGTQAVSRCAAGRAAGAGRQRPSRPEGRHDRHRARRQVRGMGVGRRRTGADHPCSPGPARPHHADEQRRDPALGRLPRRARRAEQGLRRRLPGKSVSYTFRANDAGVFMYHCGTKPVLMHIANGMYGAIVVEPTASCRMRTRTTSSSRASGTSTRTG